MKENKMADDMKRTTRYVDHTAALLAYLFYTRDHEGMMVLSDAQMRQVTVSHVGSTMPVDDVCLPDLLRELATWGIGMVIIPRDSGSKDLYGFVHFSMLERTPVAGTVDVPFDADNHDEASKYAMIAQDPLLRMAVAAAGDPR